MFKKIIVYICILFAGFLSTGICSADTSGKLESADFTIQVKNISPGGSWLVDKNAETTINNTLKRIIERIIIAMGTVALLVTIIGAGMIILYAGEDERLTKWKTAFSAWLSAVAIALLSWLMVQLVSYLIYI